MNGFNYRRYVGFALVGAGLVSAVLAWNRAQPPEPQRKLPLTSVSLSPYEQVPALTHTRIADLDVGMRVWVGASPSAERDYEFGQDVKQSEWRLMVLRAPKSDGSMSDVRMIRPASWLTERNVHAGGTVDIEVPECGIDGVASVVHVDDCPSIQPGPGRVITATFKHQAAAIIDIKIEGESKPIGSTPNHPYWSENRRQFVRADSLQPGERIHTLSGSAQVVATNPRGLLEPVYNIEIHVDHVYRVGECGALVHNGCEEGLIRAAAEARLPVSSGSLREASHKLTGGRPGHVEAGHGWNVNHPRIHEVRNNPDKLYVSVDPNNPVTIFWKDGDVVITESVDSTSVRTAYGKSAPKRAKYKRDVWAKNPKYLLVE